MRLRAALSVTSIVETMSYGKTTIKDWENFLRPDVVRSTFSVLGIYIIAYEMLVHTIKERPREFFFQQMDR